MNLGDLMEENAVLEWLKAEAANKGTPATPSQDEVKPTKLKSKPNSDTKEKALKPKSTTTTNKRQNSLLPQSNQQHKPTVK